MNKNTKHVLIDRPLVEQYQKDGFIIVEDVFTSDEVGALLEAVEHGDRVAKSTVSLQDASQMKTKLAIWFDVGNDIWSALCTHPRLGNKVRILLGEEISFFHGKVILKEARTGGAWEWHQDYGYWYDQGFAFPRMLSASTALDAATKENGCLQVLKGSQRLGRITHGRFGDQTGIDPVRIKAVEPLFEKVYCEMKPGSVLFFDSNLLHCSGPNLSDKHRRSVIMCYNALANPLLEIGYKGTLDIKAKGAETRACPVGSDDSIVRAAARVQPPRSARTQR